MTWAGDLREQVADEFADAQQLQMDRLSWWLWRRHMSRRLRRRENYDARRYLRTPEYLAMLERCRKNAKRWRLENPDKYQAIQCAKKAAADARRAERCSGKLCPECGAPITPRSRMGPLPKYCSKKCTRKSVSRAWWRRKKAA